VKQAIVIGLLFCGLAIGQGTAVAPDCSINFSFDAAGQSSAVSVAGCEFATTGVYIWTMTYYSQGFSALSIVVQSSEDSAGSPASWGTFVGTLGTGGCGANPCTTTGSSFVNLTGYNPWVRVLLSSVSGTGRISGTLYGSRSPGSAGSGGGGGGGGGGCPGTQMTPCVIAGQDPTSSEQIILTDTSGRIIPAVTSQSLGDSSGTPQQVPFSNNGGGVPYFTPTFDYAYNPANNIYYRLRSDPAGQLIVGAPPLSAAVSLSSSGLTQIIAAGSSVTVVSHLSLSFASGVTVQLEYGTGTNCGTGTTAYTGIYQNVATIALDVPFLVPSGKALCVSLGASVTGGGVVLYGQP
jgi:hypothetical protein